jgi:disulfide bond formation protein DsbB
VSLPTSTAQRLALGVPALLLAGAYVSEYGFGLYPCERCWWQRYAHFAAVALALVSFVAPPKRMWIGLAALAILVSGVVGGFHAGVEYGWWEGLTTCAMASNGGGDPLAAVMGGTLVRCDEVQWSLFGISLAGFNFVLSTAAALWIFALLGKRA